MPQTFTPAALRRLTRPCVYVFIKSGRALYVGSSVNGLLRVAAPGHHHANHRDLADEVRVRWVKDAAAARKLEHRLIQTLRPQHNGYGPAKGQLAPRPPKRLLVARGCLIRRPDSGFWYMQYTVDGRVRRKSTGTTVKAEAEAMLEQLWQVRVQAAKK